MKRAKPKTTNDIERTKDIKWISKKQWIGMGEKQALVRRPSCVDFRELTEIRNWNVYILRLKQKYSKKEKEHGEIFWNRRRTRCCKQGTHG